jgi:endo-1,4-beta-xylanase
MKFIKSLLFVLLVIFNVNGQSSGKLSSNLQALHPIDVFPHNAIESFSFLDNVKGDKLAQFYGKRDKESNSVFTAEIFVPGKSHYGITVKWIADKAIKKGDILLAKLAMRTLYAKQESGESVIYFYVNKKNFGGDKSIITQLGSGPEWKNYDIPFVALNDMPVGEGEIYISLGALSQKIEIKELMVLNFENKITVEQLPTTRFSYMGREEHAAWRTKALKRIEELRTSPFQINVKDGKGKPIAGATVTVKMKSSDFIWGTAVNEAILANDLPDSKRYKEVLSELFNTVVIENGFKGGQWKQSEKGQENTIKAFEWAENNGFRQRGHNLVWPAWKFNPAKVKALAQQDPVAFEKYIEDEILDKTSYLKGRIIGWDVINELMHEKEYFVYLPKDIEVKWFKMAKTIDPNAALFINDYGMLNSIASPQNIKEYLELISDLKSKGAPIDAIGVQGHVGRQPRNPEQVLSDLELFRPMGLPVQITEFDINMKDEALQADYTRDFLIACYSSSVVTGLTIWGFWEEKHWKPDAAMFTSDWTPKGNAKVWRDLVTNQWKTKFSKVSNKDGNVNETGHLGVYEVTVTKGNVVVKTTYHLTKSSQSLDIKL